MPLSLSRQVDITCAIIEIAAPFVHKTCMSDFKFFSIRVHTCRSKANCHFFIPCRSTILFFICGTSIIEKKKTKIVSHRIINSISDESIWTDFDMALNKIIASNMTIRLVWWFLCVKSLSNNLKLICESSIHERGSIWMTSIVIALRSNWNNSHRWEETKKKNQKKKPLKIFGLVKAFKISPIGLNNFIND